MMRGLYDTCSSAFTKLDEEYAQMKRDGLEQVVNAAGVKINFGFDRGVSQAGRTPFGSLLHPLCE